MRLYARGFPALITIAGVAAMLLRRPAGISAPYVWAEDGTEFWFDVLSSGNDLLRVYEGQLWLVQRVVFSALTAVLPISAIPVALYVTACVLGVAALSVVLQRRVRPLFGRFRWQFSRLPYSSCCP